MAVLKMKLVFGDAKLLRIIFNAVSVVIDEATMRVNPDEGLNIRALDMAEVVMVDLSLPKESFETYDVKGAESVSFRISDVLKLLRSTMPNEKVRIEPLENQLTFHITGAFTRTFGVPIFGSGAKDLPLPKVVLKNKFTVPTEIMSHMTQDGSHVSDTVQFETYENKIILSVKGEISSFRVELLPEDGTLIDYAITPPLSPAVTYDLTRLSKIIQTLVSEKITIAYGEDLPLHIASQLDSKGRIDYFLAPRAKG